MHIQQFFITLMQYLSGKAPSGALFPSELIPKTVSEAITENIFWAALVYAVLVPLVLWAVGLIVHGVSALLTNILAVVTGPSLAFVARNYLTYIGTVVHELSHALFAVLTGAKVTRITLVPHGATLGSVDFVPRGPRFFKGLQLSLTSIAPTVVGAAAIIFLFIKVYPLLTLTWHYILFWYLAVSILFHMNLSPQDLKNFSRGILPFLATIYLIALAILAIGKYM